MGSPTDVFCSNFRLHKENLCTLGSGIGIEVAFCDVMRPTASTSKAHRCSIRMTSCFFMSLHIFLSFFRLIFLSFHQMHLPVYLEWLLRDCRHRLLHSSLPPDNRRGCHSRIEPRICRALPPPPEYQHASIPLLSLLQGCDSLVITSQASQRNIGAARAATSVRGPLSE